MNEEQIGGTGPKTAEKNSSKAQSRLIILCWTVYTFSYLGRYSFSSNNTNIIDHFGVSRAEAGLVTAFFFFAYGAGQFVNGMLCRKYNKKIAFPAVLLTAALSNLLIFSGIPFFLFKYVWLVNGFAQSVLWSSVINILAESLDEKHLKKSYVILGTTTAAGTFITYAASSLFTAFNRFMAVFPFAAAVLAVIAVIWVLKYEKTRDAIKIKKPPESLPSPGKEVTSPSAGRFTKAMAAAVAVFAFFAVTCNFMKDGLQTWVPVMLKEIYDLGDSGAILTSLILPLLSAACGAFTVLANKYIKDIVLLTSVLFAVSAAFTVVLKVFIGSSFVLSAVLFGLISFMSHSINTCVTAILPLSFRETGKSGLLSGVLNGCCYAGSTVSAYGLGSAADRFGWNTVFILFIAVSAAASVLGLIAQGSLRYQTQPRHKRSR